MQKTKPFLSLSVNPWNRWQKKSGNSYPRLWIEFWDWIPPLLNSNRKNGTFGKKDFILRLRTSAYLLTCFLVFSLLILSFPQDLPADPGKTPWPVIIKDLEIIIAANQPDSIKFFLIDSLFRKNRISIADYQAFYKTYVQEKPQKSIKLLEKVERILREEMKVVNDRKRKKKK